MIELFVAKTRKAIDAKEDSIDLYDEHFEQISETWEFCQGFPSVQMIRQC